MSEHDKALTDVEVEAMFEDATQAEANLILTVREKTAHIRTLESALAEAKRELDQARQYIDGQNYRSDFRTAGEMRAALDFLRHKNERHLQTIDDLSHRLEDERVAKENAERVVGAVRHSLGMAGVWRLDCSCTHNLHNPLALALTQYDEIARAAIEKEGKS